MQRNISMDDEILNGLLFDGISFSSFKFDPISKLCCKYHLAIFKFMKNKYLNDIYRLLNGGEACKDYEFRNEKYFISRTLKALKESTLLLSEDKNEIKIYKKIKKDDIVVSHYFSLEDLPYNIFTKKICLFVYNENDKRKYSKLVDKIPNLSFISLDEGDDEDYIYDKIKVKILRDESDVYFVSEGNYSNYIVNSLYSLDKIGINL